MGPKEKAIGDRGQFPLETGDLSLKEAEGISFFVVSEPYLSTRRVWVSYLGGHAVKTEMTGPLPSRR